MAQPWEWQVASCKVRPLHDSRTKNWTQKSIKILDFTKNLEHTMGNPRESFIFRGLWGPIYWGPKTFIFLHGFGVQRRFKLHLICGALLTEITTAWKIWKDIYCIEWGRDHPLCYKGNISNSSKPRTWSGSSWKQKFISLSKLARPYRLNYMQKTS